MGQASFASLQELFETENGNSLPSNSAIAQNSPSIFGAGHRNNASRTEVIEVKLDMMIIATSLNPDPLIAPRL